MLTTARGRLAASGVIAALAILLTVNGLPSAQTIPGPAAGIPARGGMDMDKASPVAEAAPMDQSMAQMMENCMAMMEMMGGDMSGMMGGDMSGMMATPGTDMEGMDGMDDAVMPTTTPSS